MKRHKNLSRRERQIMDIIYELNEATVTQVLERITNPPSYSTVRALLRVLEEKGNLFHKKEGPRYIYMPTLSREKARQSALKHLMKIFFIPMKKSWQPCLISLKIIYQNWIIKK